MKQPGKMTYAPLFFTDFKEGCEDMTNEQVGAYLRVLFEIYQAMGPIDFNDRILGKRLNCRPHKAHAMVESLIIEGKLFLTPIGQISNHRAESEILKFVSISVQNQLNGSSPKLNQHSPRKKPNKFSGDEERSLSGRETILDLKTKNLSSLGASARHVASRAFEEEQPRGVAGIRYRQAQRAPGRPKVLS